MSLLRELRGLSSLAGYKLYAQSRLLCTKLRPAKGDDMKRRWLRRIAMTIIAACTALASCSNDGGSTTTAGPTTAYAVLRLNSNGVPDTTFAAPKGIAVTDVANGLFDFALAVAVQTDGKILAAGSSGLSGQGVIALVRYDQFGVLDPGFGTGGVVKTPLPSVASSASAIAVQPDGQILVAAVTYAGVV